MKKNLIIKILLFVTVIASALSFTACIGEQSYEDYLKENKIYSFVTYYANGGTFNNKAITEKYLGLSYKDGEDFSVAYCIDETGTRITVAKTDYVFSGWYYAELDDDGNVIWLDKENNLPKVSDKRAEFPLKVERNTSLYLCATWAEDVKVEYYLVSDTEVIDDNGNKYVNGDLLTTEAFGRFDSIDTNNKTPLSSKNATCLQIYADKDCLTPVTKVEKPSNGENVKLYAKYIDGVWTFVRNSTDVKSMFGNFNTEGKKYYLLNDIDCLTKGEKLFCPSPTNFKGTIQGNGYKISNVYFSASSIGQSAKVGALGKLCATAKITDLTLENVDVEYQVRGSFTSLYALFSDVEDGVDANVFSNFVINNLKLSITIATDNAINNIPQKDGEYVKTNMLFGGYDTDALFLEKFKGITVNNAELNIEN